LSTESTHAKDELTTCRLVQEQKKRPLSWVDLELPFRLHMTNKYLAIPFVNSDSFHEPHELRCTVFVEFQMNIELS
jgi:hypothetical protein